VLDLTSEVDDVENDVKLDDNTTGRVADLVNLMLVLESDDDDDMID